MAVAENSESRFFIRDTEFKFINNKHFRQFFVDYFCCEKSASCLTQLDMLMTLSA